MLSFHQMENINSFVKGEANPLVAKDTFQLILCENEAVEAVVTALWGKNYSEDPVAVTLALKVCKQLMENYTLKLQLAELKARIADLQLVTGK